MRMRSQNPPASQIEACGTWGCKELPTVCPAESSGKQQVAAFFKPGDAVLGDPEGLGNAGLRKLAGLSQIGRVAAPSFQKKRRWRGCILLTVFEPKKEISAFGFSRSRYPAPNKPLIFTLTNFIFVVL